MAEYKRLISYIYSYENGVKGKNAGFARIETRNGICRINLSVRFEDGLLNEIEDNMMEVYFFCRTEPGVKLIFLDRMNLINGCSMAKIRKNIDSIGKEVDQLSGIFICSPAFLKNKYPLNLIYASEWDDIPIRVDEFKKANENQRSQISDINNDKEILHNSQSDLHVAYIGEEEYETVSASSLINKKERLFGEETNKDRFGRQSENSNRMESEPNAEMPLRQETPQRQEMPLRQETPQRQEMPLRQETPQKQEMPLRQETPQRQEMPLRQETPQRQEMPLRQETPQRQEMPLRQETPQRQGMPYRQNMPQRQEMPYRQETPQRQGMPYRQNMPQRQEMPLRQEAPQWQEMPNRQETPQMQEMPLRQETPQMQEMPLRQETPQRQEMPNRQETPQRQEMPLRQETPQMQEMPLRQEEPQMPLNNLESQHMRNQKNPHKRDEKHFFQVLSSCYPKVKINEINGECIKITPHDISYLPKKYWSLSNNSFMLHGFYNYKYLILCEKIVNGARRYFIGVPGLYHQKEQSIARMFGFTEFEGNRRNASMNFGYWCMYLQ